MLKILLGRLSPQPNANFVDHPPVPFYSNTEELNISSFKEAVMEAVQSQQATQEHHSSFYKWAYPLAGIIALALLGLGIALAAIGASWAVLAVGVGAIVGVLLVWPIATALFGQDAREQARHDALVKVLEERLRQQSVALEMMAEQQLLSDRAKAIAFREKDREALRRAVEEEIGREDWEAAMLLAGEIESQFGSRREADLFREQIVQGRRRVVRQHVDQAIQEVDRHVRAEQWGQASHEADRIAALYPEDEQARQLPNEVRSRREQHKKRLLDSWHEAVGRKDTDGGIEILKQLDAYLTPGEAQSLQEAARGVFKDKLEHLRLEFTAAVQADHWQKALDLAETIISDFPNTRIAHEVGQKLEALRLRAAREPETASA
jgi:hypothetical protein